MTTKSQIKLMDSLNFTEEDLAANRDGYMSEQQKVRWRAKRRQTTNAYRLGQIVIILMLAGLVQIAVYENRTIWLAFVVGLMGLSVLWALGNLLNPAADYEEDLRKGHVYSVCGKLHRTTQWNGRYRIPQDYYHKIQVEAVVFRANGYQWSALHNGKSYCVYYIPGNKAILSAEEMI